MSPRDLIVQQALALTLEDQVFVAQALSDHLDERLPSEGDELCDRELLAELDRRMHKYLSGEHHARDAADVLADLYRREADESAP